ncbi:MAG: hypothetical protein IPK77_08410 [Cellvibrio sp.]|nr:hypothetical protein [Cellvibrio sp.]
MRWLLGAIMACLPIMVWADDTSSAIEIDSSCQPIAVDFNTIAEEKNHD